MLYQLRSFYPPKDLRPEIAFCAICKAWPVFWADEMCGIFDMIKI
jgi:hypothetical protein